MPTSAMKAIERLKRATRRGLLAKTVTLADGEEFTICFRPLTLAEDERIRNDVGDKPDANAYALRLLVERALNSDGTRMFSLGDLGTLRREVEKEDVEKLMLVLLSNEGEPLDLKSTRAGSEE